MAQESDNVAGQPKNVYDVLPTACTSLYKQYGYMRSSFS